MARADQGMGEKKGHQGVGSGDPDTEVAEDTLANDIHGDNKLQGKDQVRFRNQRQDQPDAKTKTEGVVESFENMDPKTRAERANKG